MVEQLLLILLSILINVVSDLITYWITESNKKKLGVAAPSFSFPYYDGTTFDTNIILLSMKNINIKNIFSHSYN